MCSSDLAGVPNVPGLQQFLEDFVTVDGSSGRVLAGQVPLTEATFSEDFKRLLGWADEAAGQEVWANADTPEDARRAREFGARGIGLCRTEHMFMATDRLPVMQIWGVSGGMKP